MCACTRAVSRQCMWMHKRPLAVAQAHGLPLGWQVPTQLSHPGLNGPWKHLHGPGALSNTARTHPTPHARPEGLDSRTPVAALRHDLV
eukprot:COSAG01_NODE_20442_length_949_cov_0.933255_2_plen_87_part_01